jgi:hypothetical protein
MTETTRKRKGPTISLISGTNGRPTREEAGRKSACHHCEKPFAKGDRFIAIPQREGAFNKQLRLCDACFKPIIEKTAADVEALRAL